jgi:hypothetical protein
VASSVKIVIDPNALRDLVNDNPYIKNEILGIANKVRAEAQRTASSAENGPGGTISGYSGAGFSVEWEDRGKRPRANVKSNAPGETAMAAHFFSQKRDGVGHLRAALYKFTSRRG